MKVRLSAAASLVALVIAPGALAEERQRAQLVDAVQVTIQGHRVLDGCQYESSVTLLPGQAAVEAHQIAEEPATCTLVMEQGTPVDATFGNIHPVARLNVEKKAKAASPSPLTRGGCCNDALRRLPQNVG